MSSTYQAVSKTQRKLKEQLELFTSNGAQGTQNGSPLSFGGTDRSDSELSTNEKSVLLYQGDCLDLLSSIAPKTVQLIVTSPPYNIGKNYEKKRLPLAEYLQGQQEVIAGCVNLLKDGGSICWEVGNHVQENEVYPLDALLYPIFKQFDLKLRNRIVWHYEHGLHSRSRFSGRYETILWFTKGDDYMFDLDAVRVPQKYPGKKYYKGPKAGQYSSNPLGKNPGDVWLIPNVKHNHPEKTTHPCQFPVELVERLVLALTEPGDLVVDPYMGVGSTAIAAIRHQRRSAGADTSPEYISIARKRIRLAAAGRLRTRPMDRPIYAPPSGSPLTNRPNESLLGGAE